MNPQFLTGFLLLGAVTATALFADFDHFTWWSFQVFTFYLLLTTLNLIRPGVAFFCFFDALFVMIGVFVMALLRSPDGSDMLTEVARENGLVGYGLGTFVVHYLPVAVVGSLSPLPGRDDLEMVTAALLNAITFFVTYLSFNDPSEVYGVAITPTMAFATAAIFSGVVAGMLYADGFR